MNIIIDYDNSSSTESAPAGFQTAVQAAVSFIDHLISNPISVTIQFGYGEIQNSALATDALGESNTNGYFESYTQYVGNLAAVATSSAQKEALAALPSSATLAAESATTEPNPVNVANGEFWVADAQADLFGLGSTPNYDDPEVGFASLTSQYPLAYSPTDRAVTGEYDAIGILEHEITEALGRISYMDTPLSVSGSSTSYPTWGPLDLFRYASAGAHQWTVSGTHAIGYFSVDGQHLLLPYNNPNTGEDGGDWNTDQISGDSFGAGISDTEGKISATDVLEMNVLGFQIALPQSTDFHNDGLANLLVENTAGTVEVGEVSAGKVSWQVMGGLGSEWKFVANGDFLGDGLSDYMIENTSGAIDVGEVGPDVAATYTPVAALGPEWTIAGAGNLLGDGKYDMLIENTSGAVDVGEADPVTSLMAYTQIGSLGPEWKFVGVADFLDEGHAQFLIENTSGAVDVGDIVNGKAQYTKVAALGPEWKFVETGDFLNDGRIGFLIENTSGAVAVGELSGANDQAVYTIVASLGPEWKFVGAGDYLGAGHTQFLIENTAGAVVVGDVASGTARYTTVAGLGPEWTFHG
jgi:hypothetical protein